MSTTSKTSLALFFLVLFLKCYIIRSNAIMEIIPLLQRDIGQFLCPGTDFCDTNRTELERRRTVTGDVNCCADCSCSEDCKLWNDCCFRDGKGQTDEKCIAVGPSAHTFNPPAYFMVTYCNEPIKARNDTIIDCRDFDDIAPWGSLYPVYSSQMNRIYMNWKCAACNDVKLDTELEYFKPEIKCIARGSDAFPSVVEKILKDFNTNSVDECNLWFRVILQYRYIISKKRCFNIFPIKDTCVEGEIRKKSDVETNITKHMADMLCKSEFYSPYLSMSGFIFKNIFCFLCSRKQFNSGTEDCIKYYDDIEIRTTKPMYTILLSHEVLQRFKEHAKSELAPFRACTSLNELQEPLVCRNVHCPTARIYSADYECSFPRNVITGNGFSIFLQLELDKPIHKAIDNNTHIYLEPKLSISPSLKPWKIKTAHHSVFKMSKTQIEIKYFALALEYTRHYMEEDQTIIHEAQKIIEKNDVKLMVGNTSRSCSIDLMQAYRFALQEEKGVDVDHWVKMFQKPGTPFSSVQLGETFFCYLLEFCGDEISFENGLWGKVYIKQINMHFENHKFIHSQTGITQCVKVCLHHTPFRMIANKQPKGAMLDPLLQIILFWILLYEYQSSDQYW